MSSALILALACLAGVAWAAMVYLALAGLAWMMFDAGYGGNWGVSDDTEVV